MTPARSLLAILAITSGVFAADPGTEMRLPLVDRRVESSVEDAFYSDPMLKDAGIEVSVEAQAVRLVAAGEQALSVQQRDRAVELAADVDRVVSVAWGDAAQDPGTSPAEEPVQQAEEVASPGPTPQTQPVTPPRFFWQNWFGPSDIATVSDEAVLRRDVRTRLELNREVRSSSILIDTRGETVRLDGRVSDRHSRRAAEQDARNAGATSVENNLRVDPRRAVERGGRR